MIPNPVVRTSFAACHLSGIPFTLPDATNLNPAAAVEGMMNNLTNVICIT
jgi:hypothetical protein